MEELNDQQETVSSKIPSSGKSSLEEVALKIEDYDSTVRTAYHPPVRPQNPHVKALKDLTAKLCWTISIMISGYLIPGSILLLAHHHFIPTVSKFFVCIYLTFDLGLRVAFGFAAVMQDDESLFWKIIICLLLMTGKEDLGHLHDQLFETLSSDILDILTITNASLSIPFFSLIIKDQECMANTECQILAISLCASASFLVLKCLDNLEGLVSGLEFEFTKIKVVNK
ncbi:hypothetical protein G9A89_023788 [Geosiphon pyriformis]|nr:hypothetical protein G9A89_023788 [Geosiphon pyriformis]